MPLPGPSPGAMLAAMVALPLAAAALYPLAAALDRTPRRAWAPALGVAILTLALALALGPEVASGRAPAFRIPWAREYGVELALRLDGLALLMAVLVAGVGAVVIAYSARYLPHHLEAHHVERRPGTYYALLLFFMGAMLGLVCADDLIALYAFWEATSVSSFLLIGFDAARGPARRGALKALALTSVSALPMFVAFLWVGQAAGTFSIAALSARPEAIAAVPAGPLAGLVLGGIFLGAAAKSAQAPLHTWLPDAMEAPTPVSAYLHSAAMVAAGVFLLARLAPLLSPLPGYESLLVLVGVLTLLMGAAYALAQTRLKGILAFSTISQYGYVVLALGLGAYGVATFILASHAALKAGLFLIAGAVTYATDREDVTEIGGLTRSHPLTTVLGGVLALGLGGVPLLAGFWMKELIYEAVHRHGQAPLVAATVLGGVLTLAYAVRFFFRTFFGVPVRDHEVRPEREMAPLLACAGLAAVAAVAIGIAPGLLTPWTDLAATAAAASEVRTRVALHWPPSPATWMTLITYLLAAPALWLGFRTPAALREAGGPALRPGDQRSVADVMRSVTDLIGPAALYLRGIAALDRLGDFAARSQTGRLWHYVAALCLVTIGLGAATLPRIETWPVFHTRQALSGIGLSGALLAAAAILLALATASVRDVVAAVLLAAGVGFVLALLFAVLRAPDLALVQVAVETVTPMLFILVLGRLRGEGAGAGAGGRQGPPAAWEPPPREPPSAILTALLAVGVGGAVALAQLALAGARGSPALADALIEASASRGWMNVVAMVLMDPRGLDTLGEAMVFATAALGAILMLRGRRRRGGEGEAGGRG